MPITEPVTDLPAREPLADDDRAAPATDVTADNATESSDPRATRADCPADDPGRILQVDPATLVIDANVRVDVHLDREFLASIKALGVLEVITTWRNDDGDLVVYRGQRRVRGAVMVGTPSGFVPVRVVDRPADADRIMEQLVENERRAGMGAGETADAYQQLALLGVKAGTVSRKTGTSKAEVDKRLAVSRSTAAREAVQMVGLDQAASFVEFDDDPAVVEALLDAARSGTFDHALENARSERASREQRDQLIAELTAAEIPIVDTPSYTDAASSAYLRWLGMYSDEDDAEHAKACKGHAVCLEERWITRNSRQVWGWVAAPVCVNPAGNGHELPASLHASVKKKAADMSDEERAQATAERKLVRDNNKAWANAVTVRRRWLADNFLQRKTAPPGAELFVLQEMVRGAHWLQEALQRHHEVLAELLGVEPAPSSYYGYVDVKDLLAKLGEAAPKRAVLFAAAVIFTAWERRAGTDDVGKNTWRRKDADDRRILQQMTAWGYQPSPVEQLVITDPSAAPDNAARRDAGDTPLDDTSAADGTPDRPASTAGPKDSPPAT